MERYYSSWVRSLLLLTIASVISVTFLGCIDPTIPEMKAKRQEIGFRAEQEIQRCREATRLTSRAISLPPAQAANMDAERRNMDRMFQQGNWQPLYAPPPASEMETFHQAP